MDNNPDEQGTGLLHRGKLVYQIGYGAVLDSILWYRVEN